MKYYATIITRLSKCLESQHIYVMLQAQKTILNVQTKMLQSYSAPNNCYESITPLRQNVSCS